MRLTKRALEKAENDADFKGIRVLAYLVGAIEILEDNHYEKEEESSYDDIKKLLNIIKKDS